MENASISTVLGGEKILRSSFAVLKCGQTTDLAFQYG